jgi:hypothetical protein
MAGENVAGTPREVRPKALRSGLREPRCRPSGGSCKANASRGLAD